MKLHKQSLLGLWFTWEWVYHHVSHLKLRNAEDLLYYKIKTYHGHPLLLNDGQWIHKGDLIIELHFNNKQLLDITLKAISPVQMALILIRSLKRTLIRLNAYLEEIKQRNVDVKALYGVSLLHKGAEQFGFDVLNIPSKRKAKWMRFFLLALLIIVHPNGIQRLKVNAQDLSPMVIAASIKSFQSRIKSLSEIREERKKILS